MSPSSIPNRGMHTREEKGKGAEPVEEEMRRKGKGEIEKGEMEKWKNKRDRKGKRTERK